MKTLALILLSFTSYAQVSKTFVEQAIGFESIQSDTLSRKANNLGSSLIEQMALFDDYTIEDDGWYGELQTYLGDKEGVEALVLQDRNYYKDAKTVFVFTDYDPYYDISLVLVYKFF